MSPNSASVPAHRVDPAGGCPHALNARLRARGAVAEVVLPGAVPGAVVLGHEELKEFLAHPDVAKDARHCPALHDGSIARDWPLRVFADAQGMHTADGADHRRLRALVGKAFTARQVERLRPRVEELADTLLDDLARAAAEDPDGAADLHAHFALPLPMNVICELLGVDPEHRGRLHELSHTVIVATDTTPAEAMAAARELVALMGTIAAAHRAAAARGEAGEDLTSALIAAREGDDGDRLSEAELIGTMRLMLVAGHETTLNLIVNAVRALCTHPDQLALVRESRATWSDVVDETLRWDGPVSWFPFRYPTRDLTVGGTVIPRGTPVLAGYTAAGRDAAFHGPDADRFDITRPTAARHLSFGHGAHYCAGAPLARLEATIALERLFARFPDLGLAAPEADLPHQRSFIGNGVRALPVRPGRSAG
ncbi:cytochrome P450 family protein [Streptomyces subrutilus]|uniref:Cytochrome P450 n=1 Tax=Streptomyces subrutilus TaxID=36818 RepID=A0A5P2UHE4_9ACTN|nr:cytochrome P450 [Streptomyces subrutilus]QEU77885.1 cytochrome P450 [Streptomyces subrutilus]WSJ32970.1 cytochrome P450 [Streptomyces subrutilus]GGZ63063.1 cytochrome P450 [Streptomyces subrutilus]